MLWSLSGGKAGWPARRKCLQYGSANASASTSHFLCDLLLPLAATSHNFRARVRLAKETRSRHGGAQKEKHGELVKGRTANVLAFLASSSAYSSLVGGQGERRPSGQAQAQVPCGRWARARARARGRRGRASRWWRASFEGAQADADAGSRAFFITEWNELVEQIRTYLPAGRARAITLDLVASTVTRAR